MIRNKKKMIHSNDTAGYERPKKPTGKQPTSKAREEHPGDEVVWENVGDVSRTSEVPQTLPWQIGSR